MHMKACGAFEMGHFQKCQETAGAGESHARVGFSGVLHMQFVSFERSSHVHNRNFFWVKMPLTDLQAEIEIDVRGRKANLSVFECIAPRHQTS